SVLELQGVPVPVAVPPSVRSGEDEPEIRVSASPQSRRGNTSPLRRSVMRVGDPSSAVSIWLGVSAPFRSRRSAEQAAAKGDACDVPKNVDVPPPSPVDVMGAPGASRSSAASLLVKHVILSAAVVLS